MLYRINCNEIPDFHKVSIIQVLIDNDYQEQIDSKIIISINESKGDRSYYWHSRYLIHFAKEKFNEWQTGLFNFEFAPITDNVEKVVTLKVNSGKEKTEFKNVRILFLKHV